jgi:hypothetical protein
MAIWSREDDTHPAQSLGQHRCGNQGVQERTNPRRCVRSEDLASVLRNRRTPSTQRRSHDFQHPDNLRPGLQASRDFPSGDASRSHVYTLRHSFVVLSCNDEEVSPNHGRHCHPPSTARSGALLFPEQVESCGSTHRLVVSQYLFS